MSGLLQLVAYGPRDTYANGDLRTNMYSELSNIYSFGWKYMVSDTKEELLDSAKFCLDNGFLDYEKEKMKMIINELEKQTVPKEVLESKRQDMEILLGLKPWPNEKWWMKPKWIIRKIKGEI